MAEPIVKIPCQ